MNAVTWKTFTTAMLLAGTLVAAGCTSGVGSGGTVGPRPSESIGPGATSTPSPAPSATPDATPGATPSSNPSSTSRPSKPPATQAPVGTMNLKVYLLDYQGSDESPPVIVSVNRRVDRTVAVATAATKSLLAGPTDEERAHDLISGTLGTDIPERTLLLGIDIQNGLATIDLSSEFGSAGPRGVGQVVYTLTQFPTVERVNFRLDGKPIKVIDGQRRTLNRPATRADYVDLLPPIFIDQPAWGSNLTDPVRVSGKANVFEAQFMAELVRIDAQGERTLVRRSVMADCGSGCWGNFSFALDVPSGVSSTADIRLKVWAASAMDGSPQHVLVYPLT